MNRLSEPRSIDDALDALGDVQRRRLLVALLDHNPQDDSPVVGVEDADGDAVERLVTMEHVHLPKLADYGYIDWDRESREVSKGENFGEIRPLLELLADHEAELPPDWL